MALFSPEQEEMIKQLKASQIKPLSLQQDVEIASAKPEEDILDWNYYLKDPPFNPSTIIEVEIEYAGSSEPMFFTDPWDE